MATLLLLAAVVARADEPLTVWDLWGWWMVTEPQAQRVLYLQANGDYQDTIRDETRHVVARGKYTYANGVLTLAPAMGEPVAMRARLPMRGELELTEPNGLRTRFTRQRAEPKFGADGRILYTRLTPVPKLMAMDADGMARRPFHVPDGDGIARLARWTSDYAQVLYLANRDSERSAYVADVFAMTAEGIAPRRITGGETRETDVGRMGAIRGTIRDAVGLVRDPAAINIAVSGRPGVVRPRAEGDGRYSFEIADVPVGSLWLRVWAGEASHTAFLTVRDHETTDAGELPLPGDRYAVTDVAPAGAGHVLALLTHTAPDGARDTSVTLYRTADGAAVASFAAPTGQAITGLAVAPDGERIAVTMGEPGREHLALLTVTGLLMRAPTPRVLVAGAGLQGAAHPAWAPDGETLAFVRTTAASTGVTGDLCTVRADGTDARQLTRVAPNQCVADPCFSPDGAALAVALLTTTPKGTASDIYRMNRDGGQVQRLTTDGVSREPAWGK